MMGTTCDLTEELFRAEHLGWTKLECIEFLQQLPYASVGIGWDTSIKARRFKGGEMNRLGFSKPLY